MTRENLAPKPDEWAHPFCLNQVNYANKQEFSIPHIIELVKFTIDLHKGISSNLIKLIVKMLYVNKHYILYESLYNLIADPNILFQCSFDSESERAEYIKMYICLNEPHEELLVRIAKLWPDIWSAVLADNLILLAPYYKIQGL